jgi:hypothetical protein
MPDYNHAVADAATVGSPKEAEYLVGFHADTLGVLGPGHKLALDLSNARVLAVNSVPKSEAVPQGLRILVALRATGIHDAVNAASKAVEHLSDAFAFGLAAAVGECQPEFAVDFSEEATLRQVYQRVPIPPLLRPMRTLNPLDFLSVTTYLRRVAAGSQPRLQSAIAWLRKSYDEENPYDEFVNLWMGLEAINPLVAEKHALTGAEEHAVCPHCQMKIGKLTTKAGVNYVLRELMGEPVDSYKRINKLRNALLHSIEPVEDLDARLAESVPLARRALVYAILDAAGAPREIWDIFSKQPLARQNEAYFELYSEAEGMTRDHVLKDGSLPLLRLATSESALDYKPFGRVHTDVSLKLMLPPDLPYALRYTSHRAVTVKDPEDDTARVEVREIELIPPSEAAEPDRPDQ